MCAPAAARPLSLRNCATTSIGSVANKQAKPVLSASACSSQNGLVPGRQLLDTVVDLDGAARVYSHLFLGNSKKLPIFKNIGGIPILLLLDFVTACPSIAHEWVFKVLEASFAPIGFCNLICCLYFLSPAYISGSSNAVFFILSGVLQGCPLSGFLFDSAIDPFLRALNKAVDEYKFANKLIPKGISRAAADDIGFALKRLDTLFFWNPFSGHINLPRVWILASQSVSLLSFPISAT